MRLISPSLQSHLENGVTTLCHCWRILRQDGVTLGFTDHDRALFFDGTTFAPESGGTGAAIGSSADLAVDNSEIEGVLNSPLLTAADLAAGRFDGAEVEIWRVNWAVPEDRVLLKSGILGEVTRTRDRFQVEVRGLSHFLDQTVGRLYQRQCDANVGDDRCQVQLNDPQFRAEGEILAVIDDTRFLVSGLDEFDTDWFSHGVLSWQTGDNNGGQAFVKSQAPGVSGHSIAIWQPLPLAAQMGDQFILTAGCDRRFETCHGKFANAVNFRGFHLMPGNDFIISYPVPGENNDGGRR